MPITKTKPKNEIPIGPSAGPDPDDAMFDALCEACGDALDGMYAMRDAALAHACANIWPI